MNRTHLPPASTPLFADLFIAAFAFSICAIARPLRLASFLIAMLAPL